MITTFSASELIKNSALKLCHFRKKEWQKIVSERMLAGVIEQEKHSSSKLREMKGVYIDLDVQISYCFDEIIVADDNKSIKVVEHKMMENGLEPEEWFFQYSLIQCAFYYSLMMVNTNKKYETASFYIKQGHEKHTFNLKDQEVVPVLIIGNKSYKLAVSKPRDIIFFYMTKALFSMEYDTSKDWDAKWKFKEWEYLGQYIKWKEINH